MDNLIKALQIFGMEPNEVEYLRHGMEQPEKVVANVLQRVKAKQEVENEIQKFLSDHTFAPSKIILLDGIEYDKPARFVIETAINEQVRGKHTTPAGVRFALNEVLQKSGMKAITRSKATEALPAERKTESAKVKQMRASANEAKIKRLK